MLGTGSMFCTALVENGPFPARIKAGSVIKSLRFWKFVQFNENCIRFISMEPELWS